MIHTLHYAKMLENVGFSREQSETSVQILVEVMNDGLASKEDLKSVEKEFGRSFHELNAKIDYSVTELNAKIDHVSDQTNARFDHLERHMDDRFAHFETKLLSLESRITVRMGTMLAASIAILTALHKWV